MVKFINELTGSIMYVHESRVDEYLAMGHTVAKSVIEAKAVEITQEAEVQTAEKPAAKRRKAVKE